MNESFSPNTVRGQLTFITLPPPAPKNDDARRRLPRLPAQPSNRRSTASLRALSSSSTLADSGGGGGFSLAHELAVAMMPEPSAGSKLLAEEFGIEFDEGAEGIDGPAIHIHDAEHEVPQDAMQVLAQDLESTDNFLAHLRRLDADASLPPSTSSASFLTSSSSASSTSHQPVLERLASDVIRRINDTARDREGQLRELLEYEREFRRIGAEVGGQDVLGRLDELDLPAPDDEPPPPAAAMVAELDAQQEDSPVARPKHLRAFSQDWETDPDFDRLGDHVEGETDPAYDHEHEHDDGSPPASPPAAHPSFASSLSSHPPASTTSKPPSTPTPAHLAATHLAALRALTTSLAASLTALSEHAQVNAAATADAGRKLRALRNRLGGWRGEWEGAERSRGRIERAPSRVEVALAEAAVKTKAIQVMAAS
ncbi:hypothetical protein B0H12DRAFT_1212958 [Mycena haematopus]|nr:hypothetical protein B0H12DRAFT_1212958 [Mycena haematopus]